MQAKDISWEEFLTYVMLGYQAQDMRPTCDCPRLAFTRLCQRYQEKVVIAKFQIADRKGYIEWGASLLSSWLTDKGIEKLNEFTGDIVYCKDCPLPKCDFTIRLLNFCTKDIVLRRLQQRNKDRLCFVKEFSPVEFSIVQDPNVWVGVDYASGPDQTVEVSRPWFKLKGEDGGSANLDTMTLSIPRKREEKVLEAIQAAGLFCRGKTNWIGPRYFISPPACGQGNSRYRAVKAMADYMKSKGWDVLTYHKMD